MDSNRPLNIKKFVKLFVCTFLLLLTACKQEKETRGEVTIVQNELTSVQDYVNLFPNKVVYVDVWASWCGPCLKELPHSIDLQRNYKDKEVVFLFLSVDENKSRWEATVKAKEIKGTHVLANEHVVHDLEVNYELRGIPRYLLFDKKGKLVNANADRPSDLSVRSIIDQKL